MLDLSPSLVCETEVTPVLKKRGNVDIAVLRERRCFWLAGMAAPSASERQTRRTVTEVALSTPPLE
jgi:hypothetical protein